MKIPVIQKVDMAVLKSAGDDTVPKWAEKFVEVVNTFIDSVGLALQNRLTFKDNFLGREVELEFTHAVEKEINPTQELNRSLRVRGVLPLTTGNSYIEGFKWIYKDNGNIGVTFKFSSADKETIRLQLLMG